MGIIKGIVITLVGGFLVYMSLKDDVAFPAILGTVMFFIGLGQLKNK